MSQGLKHGILSQTHGGLDAKPYLLHQEDGVTNRPSCAKAGGLKENVYEALHRVPYSTHTRQS